MRKKLLIGVVMGGLFMGRNVEAEQKKSLAESPTPEIMVTASKITGTLPHFWETVVGSERAYFLLREDLRQHLKDGHNNLGIQYVRCHGILQDEIGVYKEDENGQPVYNWDTLDKIYQRLLTLGLKPFVELSFMPQDLALKDTTIFYWKGITSPPRDYEKWGELVYQLVRHCREYFGLKEVQKWYFEVWNEPNIGFWTGTPDEYWKLYEYTAKAVKRVDPSLKVGGPASAGGMWIKEILDQCAKRKLPLDFVSYHGYPTDKGLYARDQKINYQSEDYWKKLSQENYQIVKKSKFPQAEIHITEWNESPSSRDPRHDTVKAGAFICKTVKEVKGYVNTFSYWTVSDVFEEEGFPDSAFHGGFGLITIDGIHKPSYQAFWMLKMLGDNLLSSSNLNLARGIDSWAARKPDSSVQVLVWYYQHPENQSAKNEEVKLTVHGLIENKNYRILSYGIDQEHGDVLAKWEEMGKPAKLSPEQIARLKEVSRLLIMDSQQIYKAGKQPWVKDIKLVPGCVQLYTFEPTN